LIDRVSGGGDTALITDSGQGQGVKVQRTFYAVHPQGEPQAFG
jgi:hypothetical protein